jgi:5-oxopent-3-ene-1,2,5-tricarboxylate decarboxylase / 2-hydroxyhepta-2,4-diene-1,7-dioate isomerase
MKTARIVYSGAIHEATPASGHPGALRLADGRVVPEEAVSWLAPFEVRTMFALALNYADHAQELAAKSSA